MPTLEYLQNLLDTVVANLDAGNLKPDTAYTPGCECISCAAYDELLRLGLEIAANVPGCHFEIGELSHA